MYIIYRDQFDDYDSIIKRIDIDKNNFQFDPDGSGVWIKLQNDKVDFIPMHMVLKIRMSNDWIS